MNFFTNWSTVAKCWLFALRVALGWLFFYAGITKVVDSEWTSAGYLSGAKTLSGFFAWLTSPSILPFVDFMNEWGLTLLGLSLIFGVFVRLSSVLGAVLMLLYWFPVLEFPYVGSHSFLVDDHIVYALVLALFATIGAGRTWGFDKWIAERFPALRKLS